KPSNLRGAEVWDAAISAAATSATAVSHTRSGPAWAESASARQNFLNSAQGGGHGLAPHRFAIAVEMEQFGVRVAAAPFPADPHRADRLVRRAAGRTGDAGDGDGHGRAETRERARHHLDHRFAADRTLQFQGLGPHAEQRFFRLVAVRDDAAFE